VAALWVPTGARAAHSAPEPVAAMALAVAWARAAVSWSARVQATATQKATLQATWTVAGSVTEWPQRVRPR
jgi:hypothetical protein